jgi:dinuclear metal center YbgI/SA1388 family protein
MKDKKMKLNQLVIFLDEYLRIKEIGDDSLNGLQVENSGNVNKVALTVDASLAAIEKARIAKADLLLVHHGLFWGKPFPLTGIMYPRIQKLIQSDMALYAAHLPLDLHAEVGNNAQVQNILNWPVVGEFGEYHGTIIGREIRFKKPESRDEIVQTIQEKLNCDPVVWAFGSKQIQHAGYVSGGAVDMLEQAIAAGMDTYITGEPKHSFYWTAKEAGMNVIFAGHYATETLGVKAVGELINTKFGLETVFLDLPTGH